MADTSNANCEWTWGDPCPECENDVFVLTEQQVKRVYPNEDGTDVQLGKVLHYEDQAIACDECGLSLDPEELPE